MKAKITSVDLGLSDKRETFIFFKIRKYRYDCSSVDADVFTQKFYLIQKPHLSFPATQFKSTRSIKFKISLINKCIQQNNVLCISSARTLPCIHLVSYSGKTAAPINYSLLIKASKLAAFHKLPFTYCWCEKHFQYESKKKNKTKTSIVTSPLLLLFCLLMRESVNS